MTRKGLIFFFKESDLNRVYKSLRQVPHIQVFRRNEFPEELHYKNNPRFGDLLVVAELGYSIYLKSNDSNNYFYSKKTRQFHLNLFFCLFILILNSYKIDGSHGYFNSHPSMNPIFVAHGPAFRANYKTASFSIVEVYELMCAVLEIDAMPNNGSLVNVRSMLRMPRKQIISKLIKNKIK